MTEMAIYQTPQQLSPVADRQDRAVHRLAEWAQSASAAYEVARRLVDTSFCPVAYRGKPQEATAAILAGLEVGLLPMAALRAFDVIQGQAAPRAITLRAIVQSQGHEMVLVESTGTRCKMRGRRRGEGWQDVVWTLDRARDLGLTGKDGWKKQPIAMLLARATSELARLIAADAILGIGFSAEEISDGGFGVDAPTDDAPTPGVRRMSRPKPVAPEPEPEPEPALEPVDVEVAPDPITPDQIKYMHTLFGGLGMTERADKIEYIAGVTDRTVDSSKDLTKAEASRVIDELVRAEQAIGGTDA